MFSRSLGNVRLGIAINRFFKCFPLSARFMKKQRQDTRFSFLNSEHPDYLSPMAGLFGEQALHSIENTKKSMPQLNELLRSSFLNPEP